MTGAPSADTQAALLLAAPLIVGRGRSDAAPLKPGEYRALECELQRSDRRPADLLSPAAPDILRTCRLDRERIERLLGRGFLLSQALERWRARAIWVLGRADTGYPRRLLDCLGESAPPLLYGCGDGALLDSGGLAVVGSRRADDTLLACAGEAGRRAARAGATLVSGGARGVDQAAMYGALDAGGRAVGVLADGLERAAMLRRHRDALLAGRLALISPFDPAARFHVGHAMNRNKAIYALADAALVVNADNGKGGTWAGAMEQLDKLKFVPVYVRARGAASEGLAALRERGAIPWPEPETPESLRELLSAPPTVREFPPQAALTLEDKEPPAPAEGGEQRREAEPTPADRLYAMAAELLVKECTGGPKTEADLAETLATTKPQVRIWLKRLVEDGRLRRLKRPVRYSHPKRPGPLFG